ncbi:hypothetical protein CgunFtcFv8_000503 [Champsocephalus gunnari]|uniref:Glycine N-acyltransferase-like protein n=1 Tax=Champsocephalus gunnari TaxID=52237 RepID=A0AAN8HPX1_CHAGU|nr:hypothetical protein CgunFtcFv8_000503 [Champsocephalus gunnari]
MIILKAFKDLTLMKNILYRELPQSITVLGGMLHILHNNPCHLESGLDITEHGGYNSFIHHSPEDVDLQENLLPLPISILEKSHAELVDTHLPYGGSQESLDHVRACIHHLPNLCVSDEEGRPVSWMLSDELCELRMAYTLPQHRRAGHLLALMETISVLLICKDRV